MRLLAISHSTLMPYKPSSGPLKFTRFYTVANMEHPSTLHNPQHHRDQTLLKANIYLLITFCLFTTIVKFSRRYSRDNRNHGAYPACNIVLLQKIFWGDTIFLWRGLCFYLAVRQLRQAGENPGSSAWDPCDE